MRYRAVPTFVVRCRKLTPAGTICYARRKPLREVIE